MNFGGFEPMKYGDKSFNCVSTQVLGCITHFSEYMVSHLLLFYIVILYTFFGK